mmetsp:Transcript_110531/g.323380  ORF Transcript_110531/g.323380 Transcript_110531/m.323380 type:complete len:139 (-) Transcript_110531:201-617(-)
MAPKRRMRGKAPLALEAPPAKKPREAQEDEAPPRTRPSVVIVDDDKPPQETAIVPITAGKGRGLKAVQQSKEMSSNCAKRDGTTIEANQKIKEQKLFSAKNNAHVETKIMTKDDRRTTRKDGTVIVTSCTTMKKVSYI